MKIRCVFSTPNLPAARMAMHLAREAGIAANDISLLAREDVALEQLVDQRPLRLHDSRPSGMRGAEFGTGTGLLLLGLTALAMQPLGIKLAGVGAMAMAVPARAVRINARASFEMPDPPSRNVDDEIAAGHILVVIDGNVNQLPAVQFALVSSGAIPLPLDTRMALH
ncbi:MAG TPA: hypothetical protein VIM06_05815 [Rhodanobacter sp.]